MANKRMFSAPIIISDIFCDLPCQAQVLYFQLNMVADDDGLVSNCKLLMRSLGVTKKSLNALVESGFVLELSVGVVAIAHWHVHNSIRRDRYTETSYPEELAKLKLNKNGIYTFLENTGNSGDSGMQNDGHFAPQCSVDKDRIDKDRIDKDSIGKCSVEEQSADEQPETDDKNDTNDEDDIFDFEEVKCGNQNIVALAELAMYEVQTSQAYTNTLTREQKQKYDSFIFNLNIYIVMNRIKIDTPAFVKFNEERGWLGRGGESVIKNYKKYVEAWVKNDFDQKKR